jgi:hypothetical protein
MFVGLEPNLLFGKNFLNEESFEIIATFVSLLHRRLPLFEHNETFVRKEFFRFDFVQQLPRRRDCLISGQF